MEQSFPFWVEQAAAGETSAIIFAAAFASIGFAGIAVHILAVVVFLVWLHRASRNAWALYPGSLKSTPRMAVVCWFIPFVNLVRPYRVVRSLYSAAATDGEALRGDWVRRTREIFPIWWGTWLVQNALSNMAARRSFSDDPQKLETAVWLEFAALPLDLVAAVCLTAIIWSIQARQEDFARRAEEAARPRFLAATAAATDDLDDDEDEDEPSR
jgi:hypothetical protein